MFLTVFQTRGESVPLLLRHNPKPETCVVAIFGQGIAATFLCRAFAQQVFKETGPNGRTRPVERRGRNSMTIREEEGEEDEEDQEEEQKKKKKTKKKK